MSSLITFGILFSRSVILVLSVLIATGSVISQLVKLFWKSVELPHLCENVPLKNCKGVCGVEENRCCLVASSLLKSTQPFGCSQVPVFFQEMLRWCSAAEPISWRGGRGQAGSAGVLAWSKLCFCSTELLMRWDLAWTRGWERSVLYVQ